MIDKKSGTGHDVGDHDMESTDVGSGAVDGGNRRGELDPEDPARDIIIEARDGRRASGDNSL